MQCLILRQPTITTCMLIKKKTVFAFILALILETSLGDQGI